MFKSIIAAAITALFIASSPASAQFEFTYQGNIDVAGVPANGLYDMQFRLSDFTTPGGFHISDEVLGITVTDGLFSVEIDFGFSHYSSITQYIEIFVRQTGDGGGYTALSPKQKLTSTPRAILANFANRADSLNLPFNLGTNNTGTSFGISNSNATGTGIKGFGQNIGVEGSSNNGIGGHFRTQSTAANAVALLGTVTNTSPGSFSTAVRGINNGTGFFGIGVYGSHAGSGWGIYGESGPGGFAGRFDGDVSVLGTLSKSGGSFKIDHPQDPANMFLSHSFVESPDMKNIYDGVVILNKQGQAVVTLPSYFNALNQEFRYQLTTIGGYAPVFIATEIESSPNAQQFTIAGGTPNLKVSWQVTGIRHDAWANQNRIPIEEHKSDAQKGKYLNPEAFGQSKEMGIGYQQSSQSKN